MATNHFGPFALTGLLFDHCAASGNGRVVAISSQGSRIAGARPGRPPRPVRALRPLASLLRVQLADLLFILESTGGRASRRFRCGAGGPPGLLGHRPDGHRTQHRQHQREDALDRQHHAGGPRRGRTASPDGCVADADEAATADLPGSTYVGPSGPLHEGPARIVAARQPAHDREAQRELWELSERTTGVRFLDGHAVSQGPPPADHGRRPRRGAHALNGPRGERGAAGPARRRNGWYSFTRASGGRTRPRSSTWTAPSPVSCSPSLPARRTTGRSSVVLRPVR